MMKTKENKQFVVIGTFLGGKSFTETAKGTGELLFVLKKLENNGAVHQWTLTTVDNGEVLKLYDNNDAGNLICALESLEINGVDRLSDEDYRLVADLV